MKALRTESRHAVSFHFGLCAASVSAYRRTLGIERYTPGSMRLFWRNVNLARTPEARAKLSRQKEGRADSMCPEDRERLRMIQRRPKPLAWKRRMAERWRSRFRLIGRPKRWSVADLNLIGTRPDREVARMLGRSLLAVKTKKFQPLRLKRR